MPTFIDTNVLVYAHDLSESSRQPIARSVLEGLWETGTGVLSTQILQELYAIATAPRKLAMSPAEAREVVELYSAWPVVAIEPMIILAASRLHEVEALSFWDALVIEAARVAGADLLLSEDLTHGRVYGSVRVENPFTRSSGPGRRRG